MIYDVVILGAGASGLMTASRLHDKSVAIIEGNSQIGAKILVSGGGKCNVTNEQITPQHYDGDPSFFEQVYQQCNNKALLALFKERNLIPTKQDRLVKNQYFCQSASDVTAYFKGVTKQADLFLNEKIISVVKEDLFVITTSKQTLRARNLVVATGGISYGQIGATDLGYTIAKQFGHEVTRLDPALVGFTVLPEQAWFKELSGLSTPVTLTYEGRAIAGSLLCAHKGISGPVILVASLYWRKGKITLDFLPQTTIEKLQKGAGRQSISSVLPLPKRFAKAILAALAIRDLPFEALSKEEYAKLSQLKAYSFAPAGTFGYSRAEVTRGGVETKDINPTSMESLLMPGLFFTGEVLNITGELGGYNLQWAFSSGYVCGEYLNHQK